MSPVDPREARPATRHAIRWLLVYAGYCVLLALAWWLFTSPAHAQYEGGPRVPGVPYSYGPMDPTKFGKIFEPSEDLADWFASLKRPDIQRIMKDVGEIPYNEVISCCDAGDAYPIEILEEAWPPPDGIKENGFARITDAIKRQVKTKSGFKFRDEITGSLTFHFSAKVVTREREGNPTGTAWVFLSVVRGEISKIYCVVPLPPSAMK